MTAKFFAILTHQGAARLANAAALGTKLNLTQLAVGDGGGTLPTPDPAQTALKGEKRRAPLNLLSVDPNNTSQIIAEQIIPESEGGFWIREIGLYDDAGVLIAVANCPETYKPQLQEGSGRTQTIRMVLIVSSTESVTLKIDPSVVLATRKYVDDAVVTVNMYTDDVMKKHEAAANSHKQYLRASQALAEIAALGGDAVATALTNLGLKDALDGKQPLAAALTILAKLTLKDGQPHIILNKQDMGTGGNLEGARFITIGGQSANRQFGLGITTPTTPSGNTYGQLFYTDTGSNAGWQFDQNGHARCATAGGTWDNASDIRIKYKIEPIRNALEKMLSLNGSTWLFKENDAFGMGLLAQEAEALFPDAVNKSSYTTATGEVIPDLRSINAGNIIAALSPESFREMNAMIDELKNEVASLKEQIEALKTNNI